MTSDSTLLSLVLGAPTIIGLLCTFKTIKENLSPRAIGFKDVMGGLTDFVHSHYINRSASVWFTFCSHYPAWGVAKYDDCSAEYDELFRTLHDDKYQVLSVSLNLLKREATDPKDKDPGYDQHILNGLQLRPDSINLAIAQFINMWPVQSITAEARYRTAISRIERLFEEAQCSPKKVSRFEQVARVPEFTIMLAYRDEARKSPFSAYLVFPFVSPGLLPVSIPFDRDRSPMFALRIEDTYVLNMLHEVVHAIRHGNKGSSAIIGQP